MDLRKVNYCEVLKYLRKLRDESDANLPSDSGEAPLAQDSFGEAMVKEDRLAAWNGRAYLSTTRTLPKELSGDRQPWRGREYDLASNTALVIWTPFTAALTNTQVLWPNSMRRSLSFVGNNQGGFFIYSPIPISGVFDPGILVYGNTSTQNGMAHLSDKDFSALLYGSWYGFANTPLGFTIWEEIYLS